MHLEFTAKSKRLNTVCAAAAWVSLPDSLKDTALSLTSFQNHYKIFLFA